MTLTSVILDTLACTGAALGNLECDGVDVSSG